MKKIVKNIIEHQNNNNIAITSTSHPPLYYNELKLLINNISSQLAANDISNKDRAAIVLPNGPHMATSFLAISSYMSAAPLNPNYKAEAVSYTHLTLPTRLMV